MLLGLLLTTSVACRSGSAGYVEPTPAEMYKLDRAGFVQELVFAHATPRTLRFDDYTEGSYHVRKADVVEGVRERRRNNPSILAVIVTGPIGPMWAYKVDLFMSQGDFVRVNTVWMPHARITFKSTSLITRDLFDETFAFIRQSEAIVSGYPTAPSVRSPQTGNRETDIEWSFDLLAVKWVDDYEDVFRTTALYSLSRAPTPMSVDCLYDVLNKTTSDAVMTYSSDISDEESAYRELPPPR